MPSSITTTLYNPQKHAHLLPQFTKIHIDATLADGRTLADFTPPFTSAKREDMTRFWAARLARTSGPQKTDEVVMALARADDGDDGDDDDGGDDGAAEEVLAGYVQLHMPDSESGPMRGHVQKLFVGTEFRRQGVARALMGRVEGVARGRGRWNLELSTAKPSPARDMYPKFGYVEYGTLPNWVVHAETGELMDEICFYKDLRDT